MAAAMIDHSTEQLAFQAYFILHHPQLSLHFISVHGTCLKSDLTAKEILSWHLSYRESLTK